MTAEAQRLTAWAFILLAIFGPLAHCEAVTQKAKYEYMERD